MNRYNKRSLRRLVGCCLAGLVCAGCGQAPTAQPDLRLQLIDKSPDVRYAAVKQLASETERPDAITLLRKALEDRDPMVRMAAAYGLGALGAAAEPALPQLLTALKDSDKRVRSAAAYSIPALGAASVKAISALTIASRDADAEVRQVANQSLKRINAAEKFRREVPQTASHSANP